MARVAALVTVALICSVASQSVAASTVVQRGDSLSSIALRELGDGKKWTILCDLNRASLKGNCNTLPVGLSLKIPNISLPSAPGVDGPISRDDGTAAAADQDGAETVSVIDLPPEGVALTPVVDEIAPDTFSASATAEGGVRRIRYLFSNAGLRTVRVEFSFRSSQVGSLNIWIFDPRGVFGKIAFDDAATPVNVTGAVADVQVSNSGNGWHTASFSVAVGEEDLQTQVLIYPYGTSTTFGGGVNYEMSRPSVSKTM